ncbi:hypothetical protein [Bradyrhizobium sp. USDA 10063]
MRRFLVQHGYFTRYLRALISQLDRGEDVLRLADNLTDELGYGANTDARSRIREFMPNMLKDFDIDLAADRDIPEMQSRYHVHALPTAAR